MEEFEAQAVLQQLTNGYWATQIIYVAAKLGLADLLNGGPQDIEVLATATETHPPSLYRLMRALTGLGLFKETKPGLFDATPMGRCLVTGGTGALRARAILNGEQWYTAWGGLLESVRTGDTAFDRLTGTSFFAHLGANPAAAAVFNEAMASSTEAAARAVADAYDFSEARTIVDVGGGTGTFLAGILNAYTQVNGVLFDRPDVVAAGRDVLDRAGVAHRCETAGGDFFETVPSGGDIYLLSWVIHDWDDDRSVAILRNCRRAMRSSDRLLLIEQVIPPGNEPSLSKLYDIHMLVLSGGRERREDEYRDLLAMADFGLARIIPTDVPRSIIEAIPR